MVFLVTHVYESERVRGDAPRVVELAVARALAAERTEEPTLRVEHLKNGYTISDFTIKYKALNHRMGRSEGDQ